jgi:23S rRNA pseudouridine1911/1915/1917 synthase
MEESEVTGDQAASGPAGESAPAGEPEVETLTFEAAFEDAGARLDAFLAARIEGLSRTAIKRLADDGDVLVEGKPAKPSYKLRSGERVEVELPAPPAVDLTPEEIPLDILFEDEDVVVVNKPPGLVVHPAAGARSGTLANALVFHFQTLSARGGSLRPGIVHRLDRDTSGLMVVAKTPAAHETLSDQFRARTVFKSYVALVHGVVRDEQGKIEQPLARDPRNRTRMAVVRGGRDAVSVWKVRRRYTRFTLLDVRIKTGRTHQIRVHLAWLRYPVVGDETYGAGRDQSVNDPKLRARIAAVGRQFLHAERLAFDHPRTGERLMFEAPLPADLSEFLDLLD